MQWNAQGITSNTSRTELQNFISQHRIDVVFLCETLLKPNHKFYLNGFQIYRRDRFNPGGEVAICIRKNIKHELVSAADTTHIENVSIVVKVNNRKVVLTCAYSPRYTPSFANDIIELTPIGNEFLLLGDLNARNTSWNCSTNNSAANRLNTIQHQGNFFIYHSSSATHYPHCGSTPSTIDIMLSNTTLRLSPVNAHTNELPSDHAPIVCSCTITAVETKDPTQMYHFKEANWIAYQIHVNNKINTNTVFTDSGDIDCGLEHLIKAMHESKERSVPLVSKYSNFIRLSHETENAISERIALKRQWQSCGRGDLKRQIKYQVKSANRRITSFVNYERNVRWGQTLAKSKKGSNK